MANNNMFNNNSRDRGNLSGLPIRDNYYDNAPTPAQFTENLQDRCLFTRNNNNYKNISQDNTISLESSDSRGIFLHENNYINRPLLDNNINEEIRNEYIDERDIIIDTIDRDTSVYPNIFNFTVKLGSTDTTPGPTVHRSIQNVKYLKLIKAVFPDNYYIKRTNISGGTKLTSINAFITANKANLVNGNSSLMDQYDTTNDNIYIIHYDTTGGVFTIDFYCELSSAPDVPDYSIVYSAEVDTSDISSGTPSSDRFYSYTKDTDSQVEKGRFFQLHIDQLPKNNDLATGSSVRNSFALLYPGKEDARGFNFLDGMETDKIFRFSSLGNFTNFSIKILDSAGDQLENNTAIWNNNLDNVSSSKKILNVNTTSMAEYRYSFRSANKYLRHPLAWNMQAQFIFTVGEIQIEMNKKTFN
jgi:hypothetical protein